MPARTCNICLPIAANNSYKQKITSNSFLKTVIIVVDSVAPACGVRAQPSTTIASKQVTVLIFLFSAVCFICYCCVVSNSSKRIWELNFYFSILCLLLWRRDTYIVRAWTKSIPVWLIAVVVACVAPPKLLSGLFGLAIVWSDVQLGLSEMRVDVTC